MDVKLEKWHRCQVDIEVLKELSKKSDVKGLQHVSVFFALLLITGTLAYITGAHGGLLFGFWFMEIFMVFQIRYGMRQVTKLRLSQNL